MRRLIAAVLAIPTGLNGLAMLVAGPLWYQTVPGAPETGPFNPHFVQDIGRRGQSLVAAWRPVLAAVCGTGPRPAMIWPAHSRASRAPSAPPLFRRP